MSFFSKWEQERTQPKAEPRKQSFLAPKESMETVEGNTVKVSQPQLAPPKPVTTLRPVEPLAVNKAVIVEKPVERSEEPRPALSERDMYRPNPSSSPQSFGEPEPAAATVISAGVTINGTISGTEDIKILGSVEGTIAFEHNLIVGSTGKVKADISCKSVRISGEVRGNITATNRVELSPSGKMFGDIKAPRVAVSEGATFKGRIDMNSENIARGMVMPSQVKPALVPKPKEEAKKEEPKVELPKVPVKAEAPQEKVTLTVEDLLPGTDLPKILLPKRERVEAKAPEGPKVEHPVPAPEKKNNGGGLILG